MASSKLGGSPAAASNGSRGIRGSGPVEARAEVADRMTPEKLVEARSRTRE